MEKYKLRDNREKSRYEFDIDGQVALIDYVKTPDGIIQLTHTEVPPQLEGRGIGTELVKQTLEDIERQGLRVVPLCGFVAAYIREHPEWERLVATEVFYY